MHVRTPLRPAIGLVVAAIAATACVGGEDLDTGPRADRPTTSVVLTIPEEATTTATAPGSLEVAGDDQAGSDGNGDGAGAETSSTTETTEPAEPSQPSWLEEEYQLLTLATVDQPMALAERSGGDDVWVAERAGRVRLIQRRTSLESNEQFFKLLNTVVLDITDRVSTNGEGGLLGLTFSSNGRFLYVSYTNNRGNSVVAEYEMDAIAAIPSTERILLEVEQPFSNHNGGQVTLGPDGFLYLALGDGGSGGDPLGHGQDTSTLLGTLLRIDPFEPAGEQPYGIPVGNPFADGEGGRPEIWLWGVRNPWRFSFDRDTGDLWIADVGQNALEEIDLLPRVSGAAGRGANLGWRTMEGDQLFDGDEPPPAHHPPIYVYGHREGRCSVTGGYPYRGGLIPRLDGVYLFADYCTGEIFGLDRLDDGRILVANLPTTRDAGQIVSFGEDSEGELYVLEAGGQVSLIRRPGAPPRTRVLGPDDSFPGGEIDDSVQPVDPDG